MKTMKLALAAGVALAATGFATSANATVLSVDKGACSTSNVTPTASACLGFYGGNLLNSANIADVVDTVNAAWGAGTITAIPLSTAQSAIDFSGFSLFGDTIIGLHTGNGAPGGNNATAIYRFNFASPTNSVTFNLSGLSNVWLFTTQPCTGKDCRSNTGPVPEPATWMTMIAGFAALGFALRRSRKQTARVRFNFA